ncbi:hypothetical protein ScPMuIL_018056 [Solemya velum]
MRRYLKIRNLCVDPYHKLKFTKEWLQPKVSGDIPPARGQHSVGVVGDSLVLYGGSGKFSPEIMQCQEFFSDVYILSTAEILEGSSTPSPEQNGHAEVES